MTGKEQVIDELAIRALADAYSDAVNRSNATAAAEVYCDQGVLEGPGIDPIVGQAAIAAFLQATFDRWEWIFQTTTGGPISLDGDRATSRFHITEMGRGQDGRGTEFYGMYEDKLIRTECGWRFARRHLYPVYFGLCERSGKHHQLPDFGAPESLL